jgi:hypothetical protein
VIGDGASGEFMLCIDALIDKRIEGISDKEY